MTPDIKPGGTTIITHSPGCYLRLSVEFAKDPSVTVYLCEVCERLTQIQTEPQPPQDDDDDDEDPFARD